MGLRRERLGGRRGARWGSIGRRGTMEADGDGQVQFEDSFEINEKDPDGKKFDRVSRYICQSDLYDMHLTLDINTEIYPLDVGEHFKLLLTDSIEGEKKDFGQAVWDQTGTRWTTTTT